jgi:membrane-bound lytic murein transglycosylase B
MLISLFTVFAVIGIVIVAFVSAPPSLVRHASATPAPVATATAPESSAAPAVDVDPAWLASTSAATGVPVLALSAYASASLAISTTNPACNLGWNTLAALGTIESAHGTVNGGSLDATGNAVPVIVGPTLDGSVYSAVRDTDGGEYDGDNTWDRAVGPLQFLPATWARFGADGNGDGVSDPNNIFDASLGAGRYLCATAGDVSDAERWQAAITAYNPNDRYLTAVRDLAISYAG